MLPLLRLLALVTFGVAFLNGQAVTVNAKRLSESSGVTRSLRYGDLYWTHNDSGNPAEIFAFTLTGALVGAWKVTGAFNDDWEDIGVGPGPKAKQSYLYIGDIGDNGRRRKTIQVYRVPEPSRQRKPDSSASLKTEPAVRLDFVYPDQPHDAEALLVHPHTGDLYVVTKTRGGELPAVYKAAAPNSATADPRPLRKVAELNLPDNDTLGAFLGRITGGAISPDGKRVILCGYSGGYEATLPADAPSFDSIFAGPWNLVELPKRPQGESITYTATGKSLVMTSEGKPMPVFVLAIK